MSKRLKVGIIGCGGIANGKHLPSLKAIDRADIVAFCDLIPERAEKAAKEYAAEHGRPDVIFASSVHPLTLVAGLQLAKHFGVKCVCEVRDLWPESIVVYSNRFTKDNPLIKLLYRGEKWIYKKAESLCLPGSHHSPASAS